MSSKMLIDASHPQETRVVVTKGNQIADFDFESEHKKQIRGNIYLAKVTRVEPSLQAAFVEYGGNRHGFLAFSEIHPDYYQIPVADREALLREMQREVEEDGDGDGDEIEDAETIEASDEAEDEPSERPKRRSRRGGRTRRSRRASADDGAEDGAGDAEDGRSDDADGAEPDDGGTEDGGSDDAIAAVVDTDSVSEDMPDDAGDAPGDAEGEAKPKRRATRRRKAPVAKAKAAEASEAASASEPAGEESAEGVEAKPARKPRRTSRRKKAETAEDASEATATDEAASEQTAADLALNEAEGGAETADEEAKPAKKPARKRTRRTKKADAEGDAAQAGEAETSSSADPAPELATEEAEPTDAEGDAEEAKPRRRRSRRSKETAKEAKAPETDDEPEADVEETGAEDALEEAAPRRQRSPRKHYKIQEVIKRRQILLVQVTKEERGNKGAALTTYLSLAGRYSVLMPNTARGGGISRKIAQASDRKRLKDIAKGLDVPDGMGVILRTAAAARTKPEINRDFDYLMRLWDSVRELTLSSSAPALVYEEGDLIKRSIRDLYTKEMSEIVVAGEEGYREARDFMKMLMPSQERAVKRWDRPTPLLQAMGVEAELDRMLQPDVKLKSGGYIIINQTEALVAIDVNSGRATREHSIEATALQTNLEAAEEVARQLRLRDLAGLIVIDFIDMDEKRNNRAVEKRLKDCLKDDRARIQLGRISSFGLLEMSRQRMRSSVLESTMQVCETCHGTGHVRSQTSVALQILRALEEQLRKNPNHEAVARTDAATALHVLNTMRAQINDLEERHGLPVRLEADASIGARGFAVERGAPAERAELEVKQVRQDASLMRDEEPEEASADEEPREAHDERRDDEDGPRRRRRGRRGGRNRRPDEAEATSGPEDGAGSDDEGEGEAPREPTGEGEAKPAERATGDDSDEAPRTRTRRRSRRKADAPALDDAGSSEAPRSEAEGSRDDAATADEPAGVSAQGGSGSDETGADDEAETTTRRRSTRRRKAPVATTGTDDAAETDVGDGPKASEAASDEPPRRTRRRTSRRTREVAEDDAAESVVAAVAAANGTDAAIAETAPEKGDADATDVRSEPETEHADATAAEPTAVADEAGDGEAPVKRGWWNRGFF